MKRTIILLVLLTVFSVNIKAQDTDVNQLKILRNDSTLQVANGDTSWIFNAYILTQNVNGINTVALTSKDHVQDSVWTLAKDTVYTWSQIIPDVHTNQKYEVCKCNDNIIMICLGRLYYSNRHKFIFILDGTNGVLTKEFIF